MKWFGHVDGLLVCTVQTDASGSWGCGAFLKGLWLQWKWPTIKLPMSIMAKELIPILFSYTIWGLCITSKKVLV